MHIRFIFIPSKVMTLPLPSNFFPGFSSFYLILLFCHILLYRCLHFYGFGFFNVRLCQLLSTVLAQRKSLSLRTWAVPDSTQRVFGQTAQWENKMKIHSEAPAQT